MAQKLAQAADLVAASDADVWLTFVRETAEGADPVLPLIVEGGLTWQSALIIARGGRRIAVVGNFDADPLRASGNWSEVVPYVQSIREPLLEALGRLIPADRARPRIAVNFSLDDPKADGLTHGLFRRLEGYLAGTRFEGSLVSAESIASALRSCKIPEEIARMRRAIAATEAIFTEVSDFARPGHTEREIYEFVQGRIDARGLGYGWDRAGNPIVNTGPDSMVGHGIPSDAIAVAPGHILHLDLGVMVDGYSSDIQRCWYVPRPGEQGPPPAVERARSAVAGAIRAGARALKPGVAGWEVDQAARRHIVAQGYPEYMHALGHQVGRMAHDGGGILGPRWERYGHTSTLPVQVGQVYTLELGVMAPDSGYLGLEEMVLVTKGGCDWLTQPPLALPLLEQVPGGRTPSIP
jgi:Xaa-Pro dipeptidase